MTDHYYKKKNRNQGPTMLEVVVVGIFKGLWFLIKLPFKGIQRKKGISAEDRNQIIIKRQEIENLLNSESEIELKHAVMEADKLLDHVLKIKGYQGETFADRVRSAEGDIDKRLYNDIWQGHKIRNQLAHETEYRIQITELREATKKLLEYTRQI